MPHKVLKVGIMSKEDFIAHTMEIVKGEYKPKASEPKVWFESLKSLAQVLSSENRELLWIIEKQKPESLKELERASGRKRSNLSRTLNTMAQYGIVELVRKNKAVKPVVKATSFQVEFELSNRPLA